MFERLSGLIAGTAGDDAFATTVRGSTYSTVCKIVTDLPTGRTADIQKIMYESRSMLDCAEGALPKDIQKVMYENLKRGPYALKPLTQSTELVYGNRGSNEVCLKFVVFPMTRALRVLCNGPVFLPQ